MSDYCDLRGPLAEEIETRLEHSADAISMQQLSHDGASRVVLGDDIAPRRRVDDPRRRRRRRRPPERLFVGTAAARRPRRPPAALARRLCRRVGPFAATGAAPVVLVVILGARAVRRQRRPRQRPRRRALARPLRRARARPALRRRPRVRQRVRVWHPLHLWFGRRRRLRFFLGRLGIFLGGLGIFLRGVRLGFFLGWLGFFLGWLWLWIFLRGVRLGRRRRPDLDDFDLLDDPAGLAPDLLGELLAAELAAHNHLVELLLELHLLDAELLFEAVQDLGDLGSAAAAFQVHRDNQDSHLQIKQTCIG